MKRAIACVTIVLILCLAVPGLAESAFSYRFADAGEAAELLLSNRDYYENLTQNDLNFRMQKADATLAELEALAAKQTLDYSDAEKAAIDKAVARIDEICRERGYTLPRTEGIVFAKTTMREECGAAGYTHGTQIYLGQMMTLCGLSEDAQMQQYLLELVAHELFHCLTRNHPDFRQAMYGILGFTVEAEDYPFSQAVRDVIISNPDVEHHNSHAAFEIGGEMKECAVVFTTTKPFEKAGDSFFYSMATGLVPVDDPGTMYTADEAANFFEVFGRNTDYVVDPEETMADNFSYVFTRGLDADYKTPEIIEAIDAYLKRPDGE